MSGIYKGAHLVRSSICPMESKQLARVVALGGHEGAGLCGDDDLRAHVLHLLSRRFIRLPKAKLNSYCVGIA